MYYDYSALLGISLFTNTRKETNLGYDTNYYLDIEETNNISKDNYKKRINDEEN